MNHFFKFLIICCFMNAHAAIEDLVDLQKIMPDICLDLKYATKDNFTKQQVYPSCARAYLVKDAAEALKKAKEELNKLGYNIMIKDAARPLSVQEKFWQLVPDERYVADPKKGSRHNRGCAVDLTLVDKHGKELEMPSDFDDFTEKAHRDYMKCSETAKDNRKLLEDVMTKHGFEGIPSEWWHFDFKGWEKYTLLEFDFEKLCQK